MLALVAVGEFGLSMSLVSMSCHTIVLAMS
jgi:hypothetical protein